MLVDKTVLQIYRLASIYSVPFAIIIFWLARYNTRISRFMSAPVFVLLGEASYSFYLLHDLIIQLLGNAFANSVTGVGAYVLYAAMLLLTSALSIILFQWYETPARFFLRKWLLRKKTTPPKTELN
jgi:peptidoglycan/LPS O-acetylase OafA/YrhL